MAKSSRRCCSPPYLFPPTTNLYDPKVQQPQTLALPPIWKNFENFYTLATGGFESGDGSSETEGKAAMKTASLKLRASCDACRTLFLRPYVPPKVLDSDLNFDFELSAPQEIECGSCRWIALAMRSGEADRACRRRPAHPTSPAPRREAR